MTNVTFYVRKDGLLHGYMIKGHVGGKLVRGYDLVCCAVSVLACTGINSLCSELHLEKLPVEEMDEVTGFVRCVIPDELDDQALESAQVVLRTIKLGLTDIQGQYPNLIRIQQKEWRQADA